MLPVQDSCISILWALWGINVVRRVALLALMLASVDSAVLCIKDVTSVAGEIKSGSAAAPQIASVRGREGNKCSMGVRTPDANKT